MGGGRQRCSVLVAWNNGVNLVLREMKGMNAQQRKREVDREGKERQIGKEREERTVVRKRENENTNWRKGENVMIGERKEERTAGDGGKSEGGSQALARPVMIDWLAGSQQTDVRPPDQPIHPRTNPPLLPDPTVHRILLLSLSYSLLVSLAPSLGTTSTATDTKTIGPGTQARSKSS